MVFGIDDAIMLGVAAVGAGLQLFGSDDKAAADKKAAQAQAKAAQASQDKQQAIIDNEIIPDLQQEGALQDKATAASVQAVLLQNKQMYLDATRTRRDIIRNAQAARAKSVSTAYNQGAGGSSSFFGSLSQITAEGDRQLLGLGQNLEIGQGIFDANYDQASYLSQANDVKTQQNISAAKLGQVASQGQVNIQTAGLSSVGNLGGAFTQLGSTLVSSSEQIGKLGTTLLFGKG